MSDVFEYIVDGTSGLVGSGATGAIVCGVCSKGSIGKGYICGNRTDLKEILGNGVLVDRLEDIFAQSGSSALVIAVPVGGVAVALPKVEKSRESSPSITLSGSSKVDADVVVEITSAGVLNSGRFKYSLDAGNSFSNPATLPIDNDFILVDTGITVNFIDAEYKVGDRYIFSLSSPTPTLQNIMDAIDKPLQLYDVEFVYIAGATTPTAWSAFQAKAEELFNLHRPTYFKAETRMKGADEDINDWVAELIDGRKKVSARFVQVTASYGSIVSSRGRVKLSNIAGLEAGRSLAIPVQRATGRVKDGSVAGLTLTEEYTTSIQQLLEDNDFCTVKTYAGLNGVYFGDSKTLAEAVSDYRYQETIRVVFKALRLARSAALNSTLNELGDPVQPESASGLEYLKTSIGNALSTMTNAIPTELVDYVLNLPDGQDYVNNGVAIEMTLVGVPIIRKIKLYANYTYAGSKFDPRVKES